MENRGPIRNRQCPNCLHNKTRVFLDRASFSQWLDQFDTEAGKAPLNKRFDVQQGMVRVYRCDKNKSRPYAFPCLSAVTEKCPLFEEV